jgi:hypothetical protein
MGWLDCTPEGKETSRRASYAEGSPLKELPFLSSYERTIAGYWLEAGQVTQTANGPVTITWDEIDAWARRFYTEQYVEWVEQPRPIRSDGMADERYKVVTVPVTLTQCVISDWELQAIRRMSAEYVAQFSDRSPFAPCPKEINIEDMTEEEKIDNSKVIADSLKLMFGADK